MAKPAPHAALCSAAVGVHHAAANSIPNGSRARDGDVDPRATPWNSDAPVCERLPMLYENHDSSLLISTPARSRSRKRLARVSAKVGASIGVYELAFE